MPDGTCFSARVTIPLPPAGISTPISAAEANCCRVNRSAPNPRRAATNAHTSAPATTKRTPAPSNGGIVRTIRRMNRYVEPQTM